MTGTRHTTFYLRAYEMSVSEYCIGQSMKKPGFATWRSRAFLNMVWQKLLHANSNYSITISNGIFINIPVFSVDCCILSMIL